MTDGCLLSEERAIYDFRSLYQKYGYARFRISKFERYDLYVRNKDFLVSDRMITFTDSDGALMALKPDVTLSVIKNAQLCEGGVRKLYYNENVYRAAPGGAFKEIPQTGLECIGEVDLYNIAEVIALAIKSLRLIKSDYVLDISHMGFVSALMGQAGIPQDTFPGALKCVREKNPAALEAFCAPYGRQAVALSRVLTATYGGMGGVLDELRALPLGEEATRAIEQLEGIYGALKACGLEKNVNIDFSVVNDMRYYNGIVFQGFIKGIPSGVLSGGQYDRLMRKMGRDSGAIGFAVYLNELEALDCGDEAYDVDVLLLYDKTSDVSRLLLAVETLTAKGLRVLPRSAVPDKLRYRRLVRIDEWVG